jgi:hypothetical protein
VIDHDNQGLTRVSFYYQNHLLGWPKPHDREHLVPLARDSDYRSGALDIIHLTASRWASEYATLLAKLTTLGGIEHTQGKRLGGSPRPLTLGNMIKPEERPPATAL